VSQRTGLPAGTATNFAQDLQNRAAAFMGGAWRLNVETAPPALRLDRIAALAAVPGSTLATAYPGHDKVGLLLVDSGPAGLQVAAREFDVLLRQWNSTIVVDVPQLAALQRELCRAALAAFAPQARIEHVDKNGDASIRLRAASIARRPSGRSITSAGTLFRPVMVDRQSNDQLRSDGSELLPWTYLIVDKVDGAVATCHLQTALEAPVIPEYHPLRERLALGVTPGTQPTALRVQSPGDPPRPLADLDVTFFQGGSSSFVGRTDPEGSLSLPAREPGFRWLEIRHGDSLLLRLPFVSGLEEQLLLDLPDDSAREKLGAELTSFSDRLVDLVARREVLISEINADLESGDTAAANALLAKLRALPTAAKLLEELERIQTRTDTRVAAKHPTIAAEFEAIQTLIKKYVISATRLEKEMTAAGGKNEPAATPLDAPPPNAPVAP
jgi:hypothetical protein